ncbi:MAG TPA: HD domain-containing phosphohydrolase [Nitrospiraceae bacterium]|jgi:HD-GYP domain-containing protein (c-di-GMP phosphodiesterase class II)|nr:HD domain-containing phosphohydrolase [Nitrospiraceae bacterium]
MNSTGSAVQCRHPDLAAIVDELHALDHVRLPARSLTNVRAVGIRRVVRRIESLLPHHKGHGERTAGCALALGQALDLSQDELRDLHFAALLHDIGLLTIPADILSKAGPLTGDEYAALQSHPRAGAELLEPIRFLREATLLIAHHHERWDGFGYPYGLRGQFIPLGSRILALADTFDTLANRMLAVEVSDHESALAHLRVMAGSQLDPGLVETFLRLAPASRLDGSPGWGCAPHPFGRGASVPPGPPPAPF